jgi:hypothetical protein
VACADLRFYIRNLPAAAFDSRRFLGAFFRDRIESASVTIQNRALSRVVLKPAHNAVSRILDRSPSGARYALGAHRL